MDTTNRTPFIFAKDHRYTIPLKTTKNGVLSIHDPHGGIIEIHNPLKNDEKWGPISVHDPHGGSWTHNPLKFEKNGVLSVDYLPQSRPTRSCHFPEVSGVLPGGVA